MKYQVPVCVCGNALRYEKEMTIERIHRITKHGKISKRYSSKDNPLHPLEYLLCDSCSKRFEVDYDERDRIVCGELRF